MFFEIHCLNLGEFMKSSTIKVLLGIVIIFVLLISGAIYYASTKLQPEEIRKIAIEETSRFFPNADVALEKIDVGIGFNFKVYLSKFQIIYRGNAGGTKSELATINELQIKIPFWAIITGGGVVEFKLDKPEINYEEFANGNNWILALGKKSADDKEAKAEQVDETKTDEKMSLGYLSKSKINIRLNDILLSYKLKTKASGKVVVSKLVVNGLNFESPSAFELASNISSTDELKNTTSFDVLAIGQVHLNEYVKSGNIPLDTVVKISQFSKTGMKFKVPEISTTINLVAQKDGTINGGFETVFENQNKISGKYSVAKSIKLTDFNAEIYLKDVHAILGLDNSIDMSKAKLKATGTFEMDEASKMHPHFQYELNPAIITSMEGVTIATTSKGELKEDTFSVSLGNKVMDGSANVAVLGKLDLNQKFDMKSMSPIDVKVVARDIKLTEKFIRAKMWPPKKADEAQSSEEGANSQTVPTPTGEPAPSTDTPTLPPVVVGLDWANISVGGADFHGKGKIITTANTIAIDGLNFKFSKGSGKLSQVMTLKKKTNESKFNFEVANLNLDSFKAFLPPFVENFKGDFSGKIAGNATMFKSLTPPKYDVQVDLNVRQGEIKKLNVSDYVNPVMKGIPVVKNFYTGDKELKLDGNFETLLLKGKFSDEAYQLAQFNFLGLGKKVEINGSGLISPNPNGASTMDVNFTDNTGKISDILQKNTGSKILPLKLTGNGFTLKPDVTYTVSKLAKGALKTKGEEKLKEAAGKAVEKAADKLLKGKVNDLIKSEETKEKVNNLIKGLFK